VLLALCKIVPSKKRGEPKTETCTRRTFYKTETCIVFGIGRLIYKMTLMFPKYYFCIMIC